MNREGLGGSGVQAGDEYNYHRAHFLVCRHSTAAENSTQQLKDSSSDGPELLEEHKGPFEEG